VFIVAVAWPWGSWGAVGVATEPNRTTIIVFAPRTGPRIAATRQPSWQTCELHLARHTH